MNSGGLHQNRDDSTKRTSGAAGGSKTPYPYRSASLAASIHRSDTAVYPLFARRRPPLPGVRGLPDLAHSLRIPLSPARLALLAY